MAGLLIIICLCAIFFLGTWWWTGPTLETAKALFPPSTNASAAPPDLEKIMEVYVKLVETHASPFRDIFQLIVAGALVPLFTLMAGYVFGKSRSNAANPSDDA